MAESQQNADETCDVHEPNCSVQSPLMCEDIDRQSLTCTTGEADSQHVTSVRPLSGRPHLGPHDCRKHLRPITNPDWVRSCSSSDRKVKSPNGTRQNVDADVTTTSCVSR